MSKVLIVDDEQPIREAISLVLAEAGYETFEAANGKDALTQMEQTAVPMLVLLDLMMPKLTGEQVLDVVLGDSRLRRQYRFLLMSANAHHANAHLRELLAQMAIAVIEKPFDIGELLDAVHRAASGLDSIPDASQRD